MMRVRWNSWINWRKKKNASNCNATTETLTDACTYWHYYLKTRNAMPFQNDRNTNPRKINLSERKTNEPCDAHTHTHLKKNTHTQYVTLWIKRIVVDCVVCRLRHDIVDGDTTATTHRSKKTAAAVAAAAAAATRHDRLGAMGSQWTKSIRCWKWPRWTRYKCRL